MCDDDTCPTVQQVDTNSTLNMDARKSANVEVIYEMNFESFLFLLFIIFLEEYFLSDPELQDEGVPAAYQSHKEAYEGTVRKGCTMLRKMKQLQEQGKADIDFYT